jgi:hypothetical protein
MIAPVRTSICFLACIASLLVIGCAQDRTETTSTTDDLGTSINQVQSEIAAAKVQVDATTDSLDNLLNSNDPATVPKRFDLYQTSLESLKQQREQLSQRADDMLDRRQQYLEDWRNSLESVENAALRQSARERMDTLVEQFSSIRQQLVEAEFAMKPMIDTMEGIESTLAYDLSPQGLDRVATALERTPLNAEEIHQQLSMAQQELAQLDEIAVVTRR